MKCPDCHGGRLPDGPNVATTTCGTCAGTGRLVHKIIGWSKGARGLLWHAIREDGRAACGNIRHGFLGDPIPYAQIPVGQPPGFCRRIGCDNARRHAEYAARYPEKAAKQQS